MTTYQSRCGCVASPPEPSPAEYQTDSEYDSAYAKWNEIWQARLDRHEQETGHNV